MLNNRNHVSLPDFRAGIFLENRGFEWETADMVEIDKRALNPWFTAIVIPKKMAKRPATIQERAWTSPIWYAGVKPEKKK